MHLLIRFDHVLLFFFLCFVQFRFLTAQSDELHILLRLKISFQSSSTDVLDSWSSSQSHCNFTGIVCDSNQSVIAIELDHQGLVGKSLPFDLICQIQSLQRLKLSFNSLHGPVTEHIQYCTKLQLLDLAKNSFSGQVPDLSSLTELQSIHLDGNGFTGVFPFKSLENLTSLSVLSVGDNPFEPTLFPSEVLKLRNLYWLYLSNCSLGGRIPMGIGSLTGLGNLELADNALFGEIPSDIVKLKNLWQLELYDNDFSGKLPIGFGNLTNLSSFDASNNSLGGDLSELKSLTRLSVLQLFENRFSGEIPEEFGEFKNLTVLSLYTNDLTGPLPRKLGFWSNFSLIDVSENRLSGSIPPDLCKNGKMTRVLLIQNQFTGEIPPNLANCSSLTRLRLSNNSLSGLVPSGIWGLPNLNFIDLAMNRFQGSILSPDIANAKSLAQLRLQSNRFSGEIPPEISKATSLNLIDMSFNFISGEIPPQIGELKQLDSLYLQSNNISGAIPDSLSSCSSLTVLDLSKNSITGEIPNSLSSLSALNSLNLSTNQISGQIPDSLSSLRLSLLNLSNNQLSGPIPDSLSTAANFGGFAMNPNLCSSTNPNFPPCSSSRSTTKSTHFRALLFSLLSFAIVVLFSSLYYIFIKNKNNNNNNNSINNIQTLNPPIWDVKSFRRLAFSEREIINSIKDENLIGHGGSGNVYRVVLSNGTELAVKHIWKSNSNNNSKTTSAMLSSSSNEQPPPLARRRWKTRRSEFEAEVGALSTISHVNVVKLYCSISSEESSLLVYEYMRNGSLWDRLHGEGEGKGGLAWEKRFEIALGAAKGLEYLHHGCDRPVLHRDVKSSNILLDEGFKARIADFGLAKIVRSDGLPDSTLVVAGTLGYIAPEYAYTLKVTEKSDVYSYGVVLMELVTGRRPIEPEYGEAMDLVYWVYSRMARKDNVDEIVDSTISECRREDAAKVLRIAILCSARVPALRPSMRTVVQMLEEAEPCRSVINVTIGG
ncbi:hypothetical protein Scep_001310 [Stephania cephalantha]|uniref:Protein kinase domain-containing protein n=1 Tax=Stephania cephalantha TaxID=152367 RepID=A0AAP0Q4X9_9MAGN